MNYHYQSETTLQYDCTKMQNGCKWLMAEGLELLRVGAALAHICLKVSQPTDEGLKQCTRVTVSLGLSWRGLCSAFLPAFLLL